MSKRIDPALAVLGEFGLIGRIRERIRHRSSGTVLGIGDDAAVLRIEPGRELLATTDMLLEGVHFKREWGGGFALGRKTLAVNLSDIAAMGGQPLYALLGLGIPAAGITLEPRPGWRPRRCVQPQCQRRPCPRASTWPSPLTRRPNAPRRRARGRWS